MRDYKHFEPPPLEAADDVVAIAINPDDQPWEAPAESAPTKTATGAVKRVAAVKKDPPPLRR